MIVPLSSHFLICFSTIYATSAESLLGGTKIGLAPPVQISVSPKFFLPGSPFQDTQSSYFKIMSCNLGSKFSNSLSNLTWVWIRSFLSSKMFSEEDTALSWIGGAVEQMVPNLDDGNRVLVQVELLVIWIFWAAFDAPCTERVHDGPSVSAMSSHQCIYVGQKIQTPQVVGVVRVETPWVICYNPWEGYLAAMPHKKLFC